MSREERPAGIAIRCDWKGTVLDLLRDELGIGSAIAPGQHFTALVDRESLDKARAFLAALRTRRAAFNWEINIQVEERIVSLYFAGGAVESELFIVGSPSRTGVTRFYEEMLQINNEQANALRQAMKELSLQSARPERESDLYDELTRLNNELVTAQRELAKKNIELARLNDQKNEFLGIAAHDLRNPLGVILAYSHFLIEEAAPALGQEQVGFLNRIKSSSNFMLNLVNNLLDISVIEAGKLQLNLEQVELGELLRENISVNRVLADREQIRLTLERVDKVPAMMLDRVKIEQVLNNLLGNAIKFSPAGSEVSVSLEDSESDAIITVRDRGPGIPEEEIGRVFQPFTKTGSRRSEREKSAGLGLAIVKKIVAGHGGEISVESKIGEGSAFRVALPKRRPAAKSS
jgi:signal transduction histidine kinase